jgi:aminoglycoside phosphotransferase (APT) family kinase protein
VPVDALDRLRRICSAARLDPLTTPRQVVSWSNDVWLFEDRRFGAVVLRICWLGDVSRLAREMAVAWQLPPAISYPQVLVHGQTSIGDQPLAWSVTRRLTGELLASAWASLDPRQRRSVVAQLAEMLRELHRLTLPDNVAALLLARPTLRRPGVDGVISADVNALPVARARALAPYAGDLPDVDPGLVSDAVGAIEHLAHLDPPMDDPTRHGLIHGDLHLFNLWVGESGALTLLDFEWARYGPPDLELQRLCDCADDDVLAGGDLHPTLLRWLAADYPELFRVDALVERLRLYSLTYGVRQLIVSPSERPENALRLRRLIDGRWPAPGALPEAVVS